MIAKNNVLQFFSRFQEVTYKKGEIILQADEDPSGVVYIDKGFVREYILSPEGVELTLHIYKPRSYIPMMWALANIPNRYYYDSLTIVHGYKAPKEDTIHFLQTHSDEMLDLTNRLLRGLDGLLMRIKYLAFYNSQYRVRALLVYLARNFGKISDKGIIINNRFTHQNIASLIGITRETVSIQMKKLEHEGLITYYHRYIIIPDITKFKKNLKD